MGLIAFIFDRISAHENRVNNRNSIKYRKMYGTENMDKETIKKYVYDKLKNKEPKHNENINEIKNIVKLLQNKYTDLDFKILEINVSCNDDNKLRSLFFYDEKIRTNEKYGIYNKTTYDPNELIEYIVETTGKICHLYEELPEKMVKQKSDEKRKETDRIAAINELGKRHKLNG